MRLETIKGHLETFGVTGIDVPGIKSIITELGQTEQDYKSKSDVEVLANKLKASGKIALHTDEDPKQLSTIDESGIAPVAPGGLAGIDAKEVEAEATGHSAGLDQAIDGVSGIVLNAIDHRFNQAASTIQHRIDSNMVQLLTMPLTPSFDYKSIAAKWSQQLAQ